MKRHLVTILIGASFIVMSASFSFFIPNAEAQNSTWRPSPSSPLGKKEHPRLFFTSASKEKLIAKIKTYYKNDFQKFVTALDAVYGASFSGGASQNLRINDVRNFAFLCEVSPAVIGVNGKTQNEYCKEAMRLGREMAATLETFTDGIHCGQNWASAECGLFNISLAAVYDWTYKEASIDDRSTLKTALENSFKRRSDDANGKRELIMNKATTDALHGVFPFLALYGDDSNMENEMTSWFEKNFLKGMLEVGDKLFDGSAYHHEGDTYSRDVLLPLALMAGAASPALDENLFETHSYLQSFPDFYYYTVIPGKSPYGNGYAGERNNTHSNGYVWMPNDVAYLTLSAVGSWLKESNPKVAGFTSWLTEGPGPYAYGPVENLPYYDPRRYDLFAKFLWGTKQIPQTQNANEADKPLSKYLGGEYVMRSSHDPEQATRIAFHAQNWWYPQGHNDTEQTAIGIWKYGPLILDSSGNSKNTKDMRRLGTSKGPAMNSGIGLFNPNESTKDGYNMMEFGMGSISEKDANDPLKYTEGSSLDIGDFRNESTNKYDYARYDYKKSYKETKRVGAAEREVVYVRGPENKEYVIIHDLLDSSLEKRAIFHSAVDVEAVNGSWSPEGNNFQKLTGEKIVKIDNSSLPQSHGALFLKVMTPANAKIVKNGGVNHPWVDASGKNIEIGSGDSNFEYECYSIACHRIQVRTESPTLLTAMQIGRTETLKKMDSAVAIETSTIEGIKIGNKVVIFKRETSPMTALEYSIDTAEPTEHLVTGLKPETNFTVSVNKNAQTRISSKEGTLFLEDANTTPHSVTINEYNVPIPEDTLAPSISLFAVEPAKTTSSITISWDLEDDRDLQKVEIWRVKDAGEKPDDWGKAPYKTITIFGKTHQGTYIDQLPIEGASWYGIHALDARGNTTFEPNPPGPKKVFKETKPDNQTPKAVITTSPEDGTAPLHVNFIGGNSVDKDGEIISYAWDFDDRSGSSETNPRHIYKNPGIYTPSLTVADNLGGTSRVSAFITVNQKVELPKPTSTATGSSWAGNIIYIDSSAAALGNGSEEKPYKTIREGWKHLGPGKSLLIRGDTKNTRVYRENLTTAIDGAPGGEIKIVGREGEHITIAHNQTMSITKSWWEFENLTLDHEGAANNALTVSGKNVSLKNVEIKNGKRDGLEIKETAYNVSIKNSRIHDFVSQYSSDAHCIVLDPNAENIILENSNIYDCGGDGIQVYAEDITDPARYAKNITLINNTFSTTLEKTSKNAIDVKGVMGMTIKNNTLHGFANKAIVLQKGSKNVKILQNKIYASERGIDVRREGGKNPDTIEVANNLLYDINGEYALKFDGVTNAYISHNTLVNIIGSPLRIEGEGIQSGFIHNNLAMNTGGNTVSAPVNATVSHNGWFGSVGGGKLGSVEDRTGSDAGFLYPQGKDFRLQASSPAMNAGIKLDSIREDIESKARPQGNGYDLGAYESGSTPTEPRPEIKVIKRTNKTEAEIGDIITYTIDYSNPSKTKALDLTITDKIPAFTVYVPESVSIGGTYNSSENTVRWTIPEVPAGAFGTVSFKIKVAGE